MKLFSIIIACYNNSEYLEQCLDSVLTQDYPEIELVVCDDGSDSFDVEYFKNYVEQHKQKNLQSYIIYSNDRNLGTVKNLNVAMLKCHGDYYKDIAADDILYDSHVLSGVVETLEISPDGVVVGDVLNCDINMKPLSKYRNDYIDSMKYRSPSQNFSMLTVRNYIPAGGIFFTKQFWQKYGPYDERFRLLEDWPMWLKIFVAGGEILYVPQFVLKYRQSGGVVSSGNKYYLQDRDKIFNLVITPHKEIINTMQYIKAFFASFLATNSLIRRIYYIFR